MPKTETTIKEITINQKRLLNAKELCAYTGRGLTMAQKWAEEHGAMLKYGKRVLFDRVVIDAAITEDLKKQNAARRAACVCTPPQALI